MKSRGRGQTLADPLDERNHGAEGLAIFEEIRVGAPPTIGISDAEVTEGDSGTKTAQFFVTLSAPVAGVVSVDYSTSDGPSEQSTRTAAAAEADYLPRASGTVTIPAGELKAGVQVEVVGDVAPEPTEEFLVNLSAAVGGVRIRRIQGTGTIFDNDIAPAVQQDLRQVAQQQEDSAPAQNVNPPAQPNPGPQQQAQTNPVQQAQLNPAPPVQAQPQIQAQAQAQPQPNLQANFQPHVQAHQVMQAEPAVVAERERQIQLEKATLQGRDAGQHLASSLSALALMGLLTAAVGRRPGAGERSRATARVRVPVPRARARPANRRRR